MSRRLAYLDIKSLHYFLAGLTFKAGRVADVLDAAIGNIQERTGLPRKLINWNQKSDPAAPRPTWQDGKQIIIEVEQTWSPSRGDFYSAMAHVIDSNVSAPAVHFLMHSPSLDIPQRLEIPLRLLLRGNGRLAGRHTVYLHALMDDQGNDHVYYGITKRGWNLRYLEHLQSGLADDSERLFPRTLRQLSRARADWRMTGIKTGPMMVGSITTICAAGLTEDAAMDTEEYLVEKYSLVSKHPRGLNMIPGGRQGIQALRMLRADIPDADASDTVAREEAFAARLRDHARAGLPNPTVAAKWNDPAYAEAVICGHENRFTGDEVRRIRYLAATGLGIEAISRDLSDADPVRIRRVLSGRTYVRIS